MNLGGCQYHDDFEFFKSLHEKQKKIYKTLKIANRFLRTQRKDIFLVNFSGRKKIK